MSKKRQVPENEYSDFATSVTKLAEELAKFLIRKNKKYGNSANNPKRIFSKADPLEQLKVRLDDKLSRVSDGSLSDNQMVDTIIDIIGYLFIFLYNLHKADAFSLDELYESKFMD